MNKKKTFKLLALGLATSFIAALIVSNGTKASIPVYADNGKTRVEVTSGGSTQVYEYDNVGTAWDNAISRANSTDDVKIILGNNWEHDGRLTIGESKKLTLDLNGHYIKRTMDDDYQISDGSVFLVQKNATFTVMDSNSEVMGYDGVEGGVITGGSSGNSAGGVHIEEKGHVVWQGGTLYKCNTDYDGGGFYLDGSSEETSLTMTGGRIYACQTVDSADNCHGGGIYIKKGTVNISNATIDDCYSEDNGGGIYIDDGYLNVYNTVFSNNYAKEEGGALYLAGDALIYFRDCIFAGNKADDDGGALYINNNPSEKKAEEFSNLGYPATIFDGCVFSDNKAGNRGGAIFIDDDNVALINVSINHNEAKTGGGGVWVDSLSDITFKGKCIVKDNTCTENSAFRNVTLQKLGASKAYVYSAGLYAGSYIGINSDSSSEDVQISLKMSKYQMQYFHADAGSLVMRDEYEEDADMVVTASLFGNGIFWVSVGLGGVGIAAVVFVIIYRKKIAKKPKVEGNTGVEEDE